MTVSRTISDDEYLLYKNMMKLYPERDDRGDMLARMAEYHFRKHEYERAIGKAEKYLKTEEKKHRTAVLQVLAESYIATGSCVGTLAALERLSPRGVPGRTKEEFAVEREFLAETWRKVGECWQEEKDKASARSAFRRALEYTYDLEESSKLKKILWDLTAEKPPPPKPEPVITPEPLLQPPKPKLTAKDLVERAQKEKGPEILSDLIGLWLSSRQNEREVLDGAIRRQIQRQPELWGWLLREYNATPYAAYTAFLRAEEIDVEEEPKEALAAYRTALELGLGPFPKMRKKAVKRVALLTADPGDIKKIGLIASLSGDYGALGRRLLAGTKLALDDYNKKNKTDIRLIIRDSQGNPEKASQMARELVKKERVFLLMGGTFSITSRRIAEVAVETKTPYLSPLATDPKLSGDLIVSTGYKESDQAYSLANYMVNVMGHQKIGLLYVDDGYGQDFKDSLQKQLLDIGIDGKMIKAKGYKKGSTDFQRQLKALKKFKAEALCLVGNPYELSLILPQVHYYDLVAPKYAGNGFYSPQVINMAPKYNNGAIFTIGYYAFDEEMVNKRFTEMYRQSYDEDADMIAALSYDAMNIVLLSWSFDIKRQNIFKKIRQKKNYKGVAGTLHIPSKGPIRRDSKLLQLLNGKLQILTE